MEPPPVGVHPHIGAEPADDEAAAARRVLVVEDRVRVAPDAIEPDELRRLFYYLIDTVLERPAENTASIPAPAPAIISPTSIAVRS